MYIQVAVTQQLYHLAHSSLLLYTALVSTAIDLAVYFLRLKGPSKSDSAHLPPVFNILYVHLSYPARRLDALIQQICELYAVAIRYVADIDKEM